MSAKAYFLSDLHLKTADEKNCQVLLRFLRSVYNDSDVTHLFLLGDVFDFWISDHSYFIAKFHTVVEAIDKLVQRGIQVFYFEGNHDLHLEKFWQRKLGVQVYTQPQYFYLDDIVIRVEHGDLIDPDDKGYLFLKRLLNTKTTKFIADYMHESVVSCVGEKASQVSRHYTSNKKTIENEVQLEKMHRYSRESCLEKPFDLHIAGHVHIKDDFIFEIENKPVRSINLGCWMDHPIAFVATASKQEFTLLV